MTLLQDDRFSIDCTGNACVGDFVRFKKDIFSGSLKKPKFEKSVIVEGEIVKDSYGGKKGQHTFTILCSDGEKMLIKGRNLYKHGTFRQAWEDESGRELVLQNKYKRRQNCQTFLSQQEAGW